jgi:hypothetical protein
MVRLGLAGQDAADAAVVEIERSWDAVTGLHIVLSVFGQAGLLMSFDAESGESSPPYVEMAADLSPGDADSREFVQLGFEDNDQIVSFVLADPRSLRRLAQDADIDLGLTP